jgi:hypothetical protein
MLSRNSLAAILWCERKPRIGSKKHGRSARRIGEPTYGIRDRTDGRRREIDDLLDHRLGRGARLGQRMKAQRTRGTALTLRPFESPFGEDRFVEA